MIPALTPRIDTIDNREASTLIQDFTTIGNVGDVGQQFAGHELEHSAGDYNEPASPWSELLAYFKFGSGGGAIILDEKGSYPLTNVNTVSQLGGIFGGSIGSSTFNGTNQYFTNAALLNPVPASIVWDFWIYNNGGTGTRYIAHKHGLSGPDHSMSVSIGASPSKIYLDGYVAGTGKTISSITSVLSNVWYYVCCSWDVVEGLRLWINGNLEASDTTATTLMSSGSYNPFTIGARDSGAANFWLGRIAHFRIRNKILTQEDVDVAYATKYIWPINANYSLPTSTLSAYIKRYGNNDLLSQVNMSALEVARKSDRIYRLGNALESTDSLKILGRY